jgi:tetratricopeptide (TPR) repeat protein
VLRSATAMLDRPAAAHAHRFLGVVAGRLARFAEAHEHMRQSAELCRAAGDRAGAAEHAFILSYVCWLQGDHDGAIANVETSLAGWADLGHHAWEGKASNAAGWYHAQLGRHRRALAYAERAVAAERRACDEANEAVALTGLGQAHHALGQYEAALPAYDRGLILARAVPDLMLEAQVLTLLGDTCTALGAADLAREHYEDALKILSEAAHPAAADVARKLA